MTDLSRSHVDVPTPDGVADAYFVHPSEGEHPAVLVFMDGIGLRPRLEEMADRIAAGGCAVLVPNLFYRAGRAPLIPDLVQRLQTEDRATVFAELRTHIDSLTPESAERDTAAYVAFLDRQPAVRSGPIATVGYCMGGALSLRAAAQLPDRVVAAASFHGGRLATDSPQSPHTVVGGVRAELYFGHADNDASMTSDQIAQLEAALDAAGVRYTSELYDGAAHGYTMSDMPAHDAKAEQRHWDALLGLLDRNFGRSR